MPSPPRDAWIAAAAAAAASVGDLLLLVVANGRTTQIWRAEQWLGPLSPFITLDTSTTEITAESASRA